MHVYYKFYVTWEASKGHENLKKQLDLSIFVLGLMKSGQS